MEIKDRKQLAQYFNSLKFKVGAEIGVSEGRNARTLCRNIKGLTLYCVDIWESDDRFRRAKERLANYNATLIRKPSMEALKDFKDESLDFVFIDGNHTFDYVMEDLIGWSRKVRHGGIISGHDYYHFRNSGVIEAVNAYISAHRINLYLTGVDLESSDDKMPSFFFTKP